MDSVLKLIYNDRFAKSNGHTEYILNGLHPSVISYIQKFSDTDRSLHSILDEIQGFNNSDSWSCLSRHSNFWGYTYGHFGHILFITKDQILDDDSIYLYPIEVGTTLDHVVSDHELNINGITYKYHFIDTIDPAILNHLRTGKVKLLINYIHDPLESIDPLVKIENYLNSNGIDSSNCVLIGGNNYQDYYKYYKNGKLKITSGFVVLGQPAHRMNQYPTVGSLGYESDMIRESDLDRKKVRPKKFLCFNRTMRHHRYILAYFAFKHNLIENSIFSFVNTTDTNALGIKNIVTKLLDEDVNFSFFEKMHESLPVEIDTQHLPKDKKNGFTCNNNKKEFYANTYIHIVSETSYNMGDSRYPFFSEKTFHPLVNLQPFIYVGNPYSMHTLRELGFKTFDPYIDESYDTEIDPIRRFKLIEKEIVKLNSMPHEKLHDLYYELADRTIYNQNHLRTFIDHYPFDIALNDIVKFYKNESR